MEIELLNISNKLYEKYKDIVKKNEKTSIELARKKMTRNFLLSKQKPTHSGRGIYCRYGRLHFIVSENNEVVWMRNNNATSSEWQKDLRLYMELNEKLGIENRKSFDKLQDKDRFYRTKRKIDRLKYRHKDEIIDNGYMKWNNIINR